LLLLLSLLLLVAGLLLFQLQALNLGRIPEKSSCSYSSSTNLQVKTSCSCFRL
jgi:hypothetical protein